MHKVRVPIRRALRRRWLEFRARWSIPTLLASFDEQAVVSCVAGTTGGLVILTVGLLAWLTDVPLMFPALGPTAFILITTPFSASAAPRCVLLGHFFGIGVGAIVAETARLWAAAGGWEWPPYISATIALAITCVLLVRLRCPHAPAAASALIVAMGAISEIASILAMMFGVCVITGEVLMLNWLAGLRIPSWNGTHFAPDN